MQRVAVGIALVVLSTGVYVQSLSHGYAHYDDTPYVTSNAAVQQGLSIPNARWAATTAFFANWHPLTWLSLMLDAQVWGIRPFGFHLTNFLLHSASVLVLFLAFCELSDDLWPSALVAALFAVHPLHAESVCAVSERKGLLSTFFGLCALWGYARFVRHGGAHRYILAFAALLASLCSKQMLVTMPFVLLLLDYWPLGRWRAAGGAWGRERPVRIARLLVEKLPFFLLAAGFSVVAYWAQAGSGAVASLAELPVQDRLANAVNSYALYLKSAFLPIKLAAFYPHPGAEISYRSIVLSSFVIGLISVGAWRWRRSRPYVLVGWLWYLGTLVPVIGLIQVSYHARADRYTDIPLIGVYLIVAWTLLGRLHEVWSRWFATAAGTGLCLVLLLGWRQAGVWRDAVTLFEHSLAVTENNYLAHTWLGIAYAERGDLPAAEAEYMTALRVRPGYAKALENLGAAYARERRLDKALHAYAEALTVSPDDPTIHFNIGSLLALKGQVAESTGYFRQAIARDPDYLLARWQLARVLIAQGSAAEAAEHLRTGLAQQPENYRLANDLAWLQVTRPELPRQRGDEAIRLSQFAVDGTNAQDADLLDTLAAAYADAGRFDKAIQTARYAVRIAAMQNQHRLAEQIARRVAEYEQGRTVPEMPEELH